MARLYADENFPLPVVEELRKTGHDVLTIQEDGKANRNYSASSGKLFEKERSSVKKTKNDRRKA